MAIGVESANVDLDSIFDPLLNGMTPAPNTGLRYGAIPTDLAAKYAPLSYGFATSPTGIKVGSGKNDLNTIFAAIGTSWSTAIAGAFNQQGPVTGTPNKLAQAPQFVADAPHQTVTSYTWTVTKTGGSAATSAIISSGQGTSSIIVAVTISGVENITYTVQCAIVVGGNTKNTSTLSCSASVGGPNAASVISGPNTQSAIFTSTGTSKTISISKTSQSAFSSFSWTLSNITSSDGSGTASISSGGSSATVSISATIPTNGWLSFEYSCDANGTSGESIATGGVICEY